MFSHEKLKKRRLELNLTQSSIYQELGISRKTYSAWENGLANLLRFFAWGSARPFSQAE